MTGQTISHYKILEKLGGGGMGIVYKAEDTKLKRTVALKFLPPDLTSDPEAKTRFIHEAQAASVLQHSNICTIHDIDETADGQLFICMDCYDGETLKKQIERGPIEPEEAVRIGIQVADGLSRAHEAGIVHRDIKPANIMVTNHGEVKIVDFGIAKLGAATRLKKSAVTSGTAAYMSPEQITGQESDCRSDLFSLGIVLYELVTGKRPFVGDHEAAVFYSILDLEPEPPSKLRPDLQPGLERIILRLLQKDPAKRYQTAAELRRDMKHLVGMTESTRRMVVSAVRSGNRPLTYFLAALVTLLLLFSIPSIRTTLAKLIGISRIPTEKHIAVLPFVNIGGDSASKVFCDGLTEEITSRLTRLRTLGGTPLSVVPSSEITGGTIRTAEQARRRLGATHVVTGSIERDIREVRIIINLSDAQTLRQLDSRSINEQRLTRTRLQDAAVGAVVAMLDVSVEPTSQRVASFGNTNDPDANDFYLKGRGYLYNYQKSGNIDLAIQLFDLALKDDSTFVLAYAGLGDAYWQKYEQTKDLQLTAKALEYCNRAIGLNPQLPEVRMTLAMIYTGTGKGVDAVAEYRTVLQQDSSNVDAHRGLASAFRAQGEYENAEREYKKAIRLKPGYWRGHVDLGGFYYSRKRFAEAVEEFKRVVELTPDNAIGYSALGASYSDLEKDTEAEEALKKSIELEPSYRAYNNLGTHYFRKRRYGDAIPYFEKALTLNDIDHRLWGNLGSAYFHTDQFDSAKMHLETAIERAKHQRAINPKDPTILSRLAGYYAMLGNKTESLRLIKEALSVAPEDVEVIRRAVDVFERGGQRLQALTWMEQGLKRGIKAKEFETDLGLTELRNDERYQRIIKRYGNQP